MKLELNGRELAVLRTVLDMATEHFVSVLDIERTEETNYDLLALGSVIGKLDQIHTDTKD